MSATDGDRRAASVPDAAARLDGSSFVRILARADGDGVAAAGVLARTLSGLGTPFQVSVARTAPEIADRTERATERAREDEQTVVVGPATAGQAVQVDRRAEAPASVVAWQVARDLDGDAHPPAALALAGAFAAGVTPGSAGTAPVLAAARADGLGRRPGVATPTADLPDGLAHSTLVHAPVSGDPERVRETLADLGLDRSDSEGGLDPERAREVASLVALETVGHEDATSRAGTAIERALRPAAGGSCPFHTLGGYADVLRAVVRESPGTAVALALGRDVRDVALSAWRERARRAHEAVRAATTARYDGLVVARLDADTGADTEAGTSESVSGSGTQAPVPVETVARLLWAYRSPEPVVLAVADDRAGAYAGEDVAVGRAMGAAAESVGGRAGGTPRRAYVAFDGGNRTAFVAAVREELA